MACDFPVVEETVTRGEVLNLAVLLREDGAQYPLAAGDVVVLSVGTLTATGDTVVQKSTDNPGETTHAVGNPVVVFHVGGADTELLTGDTYEGDLWLRPAAGPSPRRFKVRFIFNILGRVNENPSGAPP